MYPISWAAELTDMTLEELLKQRSELHQNSDTASGVKEALRDSPASMVVLTREDFKRRGYDSLDDMLFGLPGFDVIRTAGTVETVAYQRGYRTPWTQRTLLLVNGKPDNNLWNHTAQISRQYPITAIERVEVLHGPAGAVYGPNAFLGVINVITRDASKLESGEHYLEASGALGNFDTKSVDAAFGGRWGEFSLDVGFTVYDSDEPGIEDYSEWGYTNPDLLADPERWGAGIGLGVDPVTGRLSPAGDLDLDGVVESDELVQGNPLGEYSDRTDNWGVTAEVRLGRTSLGLFAWETDEGYGPYYSFADGQPNSIWSHSSLQMYLEREDAFFDEKLSVDSELVYRESRAGGEDWAESFGDFVSISSWNSFNKAWRLEQRYTYQKSEDLQLSGGWKYEEKRLNRAYILSNYWDGLGVSVGESSVQEAGDISSESPLLLSEKLGDSFNLDSNNSDTEDVGLFAQAIYDFGNFRFNGSIRWDDNSEYGDEFNPRGALIYHLDAATSVKLVYGEAFQEPSPKDLYGAYTGRISNDSLLPEKVQTTEIIFVRQGERFQHDFSIYQSEFSDAIATGQNVGDREVRGFEYKNSFRLPNPIPGSSNLTGELFYTYTRSMGDQQFDTQLGAWVLQHGKQGDVAPHKVNFNLNVPIRERWNANLSARWLSERDLFSENPLRADSNSARLTNRKAEAHAVVGLNVLYRQDKYSVSFKVENLFAEDYLVPGVESATSGDDFSIDADGFQNSLIPQLNTQRYTVRVALDL
ncbi:TonB-dependent receptor plug domain-containing protein [Pelagicoccus mobilis]|uniref:TonB-dependent receptor n=1 Tax=Pelagicoccus mobilis TaxID=415221 RepID=A0A934VTJ3_9BACT|nr:TonB-dependent receptor [Pelagicoccus mobilis]MBK1879574.1 TonB-dependent receptor [Pelagicoccus mobilis]